MDKEHQLQRACCGGELNEAKELIDEGVDINSKVPRGCEMTPLMWAAYHGHDDIVRFLLDRGANVDNQDPIGSTALHLAATHGHNVVVRLLIERGVDLHVKDIYDRTPLGNAYQWFKSYTVIRYLEAAIRSTQVIFTKSDDLQLNRVTFKGFNNNVIILTENDIPHGYEFQGHPTFTLQHIRQVIDQLPTDNDDDDTTIPTDEPDERTNQIHNLLAQRHPAILQRMQYWKMNLLHLIAYFPHLYDDIHQKQILSSLLDKYPPQATISIDIRCLISPTDIHGGKTPLHHATINSTRQGRMSQECHDLLLARSLPTVVHGAIEAGMDWHHLQHLIIMAKLHALTLEDEETGLMPFMIAAVVPQAKRRCYMDDNDDVDGISGSLTMVYEILCLQPDVLKAYDVSTKMVKRSSDVLSELSGNRDAKRSCLDRIV